MAPTDTLIEMSATIDDTDLLPVNAAPVEFIVPADVSPLLVNAQTVIDLVGAGFDVLPNVFPNLANAGSTVTVAYRFQNSGDLPAGPFGVKFYLSKDNVISTQDQLLDSVIIPGLAGTTLGLLYTITLTLPGVNNAFWAGDGDYFLGMVIDPANQIPESNEANNASVGLTIDYDIVTVSNTQQANLTGKSFDLKPEPLNAGDKFNFDFEVQNLGGATGAPFDVSFYLSKNNFISTGDLLLVKTTLNALPANGSTGSLFMLNDLTLPGVDDPFWSGDGTYYVGMIIDSGSAIAETNELDNSNVGLLIDYDDVLIQNTQRANLTGKSFDLKPEPLNAGDKFNFDFNIQNLGGATGAPFDVSFYLSKNNVINTSDLFLVKTTLSALPANGTTGVLKMTSDLTLPGINDPFWSGDGTYYVGMIIDLGNAITETNELDNSNVGLLVDYDDVLIQDTQRANLTGKSFDLKPEPLKAGDKFNFDFDIQNLGGATGAPFDVSFYLSTNNFISTGDLFLVKTTIGALSANSSTGALKMTSDLTLPGINDPFWNGDGTYYVGMIIDSGNAITETNESDNSNVGLLIDYDDVAITATSVLGTRGNDDFTGTLGGDTFYGLRGDDDIDGKAGNDNLYGDRGDDNLYGGLGNDLLDGGPGDDWLWGVDINATQPGAGEIDTLVGGFGADQFFLGSATKVFYSAAGVNDYAKVVDFDRTEDIIMLNGSAGNYTLAATSGSLPSGTGIYRNNDLIAIVQGNTSLNLTASYFAYL